jgi:MFS superfamily sulfate permease-like transporter
MQIAEKTKPHLQCSRFCKWAFIKKWNLQEYCCDQHEDHIVVIKLPSEITYLNSDIMLEEAKRIVLPTQVIFSCSQLYSIDIDGLEIIDELIDELSENWCIIHLTWTTEIAPQLAHLKWFPVLQAEWRIRESTSQCLNQFVHTTK